MRSGVSLNAAIEQAHALAAERLASGFDQTALDGAARLGFANGSFEDAPDEVEQIVEEFYPEEAGSAAEPSLAAANAPAFATNQRAHRGAHSPCAQRP